jgi:hypothetical protein
MKPSPWSHYGRAPKNVRKTPATPEQHAFAAAADNVAHGRRLAEQYLRGAITEFSHIRSGPDGYQKLVRDVLTPAAFPESIEDTLRRLARG